MCTIALAYKVEPMGEIFLVANRDEALDRPAEQARIRQFGDRQVLAPLDLEAGGTWIGLNDRGLVVCITNRFRMPSKPSFISRGKLVARALSCETAEMAAREVEAIDPEHYNGFHLLILGAQWGGVVWSDGTQVQKERLSPGYYAISERSFGAAPSSRLVVLREKLDGLGSLTPQAKQAMMDWMKVHDQRDALESTCVHMEETNYGTRSSTIIELGSRWRFAVADGPPCESEFHDLDDAVRRLRSAM